MSDGSHDDKPRDVQVLAAQVAALDGCESGRFDTKRSAVMHQGKANISVGLFTMAAFMAYGFLLI